MEIILKNFIYDGTEIDEFKCKLPDHLKDIEKIPVEKCAEYIKELLELYVNF